MAEMVVFLSNLVKEGSMINFNAYEKKRDEIVKSDVIYRCIGENLKNGIVACGYYQNNRLLLFDTRMA